MTSISLGETLTQFLSSWAEYWIFLQMHFFCNRIFLFLQFILLSVFCEEGDVNRITVSRYNGELWIQCNVFYCKALERFKRCYVLRPHICSSSACNHILGENCFSRSVKIMSPISKHIRNYVATFGFLMQDLHFRHQSLPWH